MESYSFEKLSAYTEAHKLVVQVYKLIEALPSHEKYDLGSQMRRAVISVPSNIAEGCGRVSFKEKTHFLEIAFGSLMETYCQLDICRSLNYIRQEDFAKIKPQFFLVSRLINALRQLYLTKINS